jgi:hypothetical protein
MAGGGMIRPSLHTLSPYGLTLLICAAIILMENIT